MASSNDGLTAWKALDLLYPEQPRDPEVRSDAQLFAGGVTWIDAEYDRREGFEDLSEFEGLLEDGTWYATGYRSGSDERERIPADLWTVLSISPDGDSALGNDLEYSGLRFCETKAKPISSNKAKQDCLKWLTEELKGERLRKKTEYEADALDGRFPGLSQRSFRKAWEDAWKLPTTHKSWHKRGPIKSS